ncbi:hypothetical protein [Couchioplanes azureus]|uniref:hypothetical protein n=1 Tax=Couchioplanes caeruleus TaxID=56438 RepID=UPI0016715CC1|nr:hypothetical protein [Couchioplanes caeruleus]GGQ79490.1 hypothetical protein GCM10010166_56860 [Couchioplanes caeruleus subsp. azureus]
MPDGIQIDTEQVGEFAKGMRADADSGYASAADRGALLHGHGVVFGANIPGDTVFAAKQRYAQALENTEANLRAYHQMAIIFAQVAESIARDFANVDMSSAAAQRRIDALVDGAIAQANQVMDDEGLA